MLQNGRTLTEYPSAAAAPPSAYYNYPHNVSQFRYPAHHQNHHHHHHHHQYEEDNAFNRPYETTKVEERQLGPEVSGYGPSGCVTNETSENAAGYSNLGNDYEDAATPKYVDESAADFNANVSARTSAVSSPQGATAAAKSTLPTFAWMNYSSEDGN